MNHSSYVVDSGGVRLICDPWLEGTAFNNGWALLSKTVFQYDDFRGITHLWFSHEHPDHFSPPNLRKIPAEHRRNITVLFQATTDRRVVDFCAKLGFKDVRELARDQWYEIAPSVKLLCHPCGGFEDSWLCIRTPEATLLNLNDCWIVDREPLLAIARLVGQVDVLTTQFSVSAWDGNP
ncbi:MAG: MBL fold metallo-hydrolase, partial [Candidatus Binatia bacterium]